MTLPALTALALTGSAWAVSPYDTAYGIQWNFMIGTSSNDASTSYIDVTNDGTIFVENRTGANTWGPGIGGGNVRSGLGALTPLGLNLYGTNLSDLPGMTGGSQQYPGGVHAAGSRAYYLCYGAQNQHFSGAGEDGKDSSRAMVWSLDATGLANIADRHSLSKFADNSGTLRTDLLQPTTTGLTPVGGSNRITSSALRDSTLDMVMVMDMVSGDFATLGDYEGFGLRQSGAALGRSNAFLPGIGVYNFTSNTLSGPAKQPIVTFDTSGDVNETIDIQCLADPNTLDAAEVTDIVCVADVAGSLNSTYFDITGAGGTYRIWYDVDNTGAAPADPGAGLIEVDIVTGDTADAVAAATQAAVDAQGDFGAAVTTNTVTVTDAASGDRTDAADTGATGFTITVTTQGSSASSLNNTYFDLSGLAGTQRFWIDVDDTGAAPADPGAGVNEINITAGATADAVAAAAQAVIDALDDFGATVTTDTVTVTVADVGDATDAVDSGATGFTINVTAQGVKVAGSNFAVYIAAGIDQDNGNYFGGGISHARGESTSNAWDPDGSGPAASIPFLNSSSSGTSAGIGSAYDSAHNLIYTVTWDTTRYDNINSIAPANDGTGSVFWAGEKQDKCHVELRDVTGVVQWEDSFFLAPPLSPTDPTINRVDSVQVLGNGDIIVACYFEVGGTGGANSYDFHTRRYKKTAPNTYALQWENNTGLVGKRDFIYDTATDSDQTLYAVLRTDETWTPNVTNHVWAGNGDLLIQKYVPGDFNTDGTVDFVNDVQTVGAATIGGPQVGVDTYDFNGDGDSTFADTEFFITTLLDRDLSDVAQDTTVTDVDNGDLGKIIGNAGTGTLYIDGDVDWDGDVDAADLAAAAGAFGGATSPGGAYSIGSAGATLLYDPGTGQVFLKADEAAGGVITSFQIENAEGTFVPGSYTGPSGGTFGGAYAQATVNVIGDSDTTLAGFSGLPSLGTILPTGLDLAGLGDYLVTAVYTGASGTGQFDFTLELGSLSDYDIWALGYPGADLTNPDADLDGDGLTNDEERLFGLDPTDPGSQNPITVGLDTTAGTFTFTRRDDALTGIFTDIETSTDLQNWSKDAGAALVVSGPDANGVETIAVTLSAALLTNPELYVRVNLNDGNIFSEDFEGNDGGFTTTGTPNDWAYGTPNSDNNFNLILTTGNGASSGAWGTNLGNGATPSGLIDITATSLLRSPNINLAGVTGASLSFAAAVDANVGDTVQVIVRNAGDDSAVVTLDIVDTTAAGVTADWTTYGPLDISAADGLTVYLEFGFVGSNSDYLGLYIDDIAVSQAP